MIETRKCGAKKHEVSLVVSQSGLVVTVQSGGFKIDDEDYNLAEDWTYTVDPSEKKTTCIYLMLEGDDVKVGAEERVEASKPYRWQDSPYTLLHLLATVVDIPEGAGSLDDVKIMVDHFGPLNGGPDA